MQVDQKSGYQPHWQTQHYQQQHQPQLQQQQPHFGHPSQGPQQPQQMYLQTCQVIPQAAANPSRVRPGFSGQTMHVVGGVQIFLGLLCIGLNAATIAIGTSGAGTSGGIWGGIMFVVTGILGMVAGKKRTMCPIVGHMVLCIVTLSTGAIAAVIVASLGIALGTCHGFCAKSDPTNLGVNVTMLVAALLFCVLAVWTSALACSGTCCYSSPRPGAVVPAGMAIQYVVVQQAGNGQPLATYNMPPGAVQYGTPTQVAPVNTNLDPAPAYVP